MRSYAFGIKQHSTAKRDCVTIRNPQSAIRNSKGFTLLEMVMVMTIIVILATIGITSYQKVQLKAKETLLKDDLNTMRKLIDQYEADREQLPQSLDDLVSGGYMREIPVDPFTGQKDWAVTTGEDPNSLQGETGVTDVHSASAETSTEGTAYSEW